MNEYPLSLYLCLIRIYIIRSGGINYDSKYKGFTTKPASQLKEDKELSEAGFFINHARILVGSGLDTYEKGKVALENWRFLPLHLLSYSEALFQRKTLIVRLILTCRHFAFDWAFVDPTTPIRKGVKFCVCTKTFLPWTMMPLEVVYVDEKKNANKAIASFGFGSGTLHGHLLVSASLLIEILSVFIVLKIEITDVVRPP